MIEKGNRGTSECFFCGRLLILCLICLDQELLRSIDSKQSSIESMANTPHSKVNEKDSASNDPQHPIFLLIVSKNKILVIRSHRIEPRQRRIHSCCGLSGSLLESKPGKIGYRQYISPRHDRVIHCEIANHYLSTESSTDRKWSIELSSGNIVDLMLCGSTWLYDPS